MSEPDERTINWLWENKANTGKTDFIKYMVGNHNVLFCNCGKCSDIMNLVFNNDWINVK